MITNPAAIRKSVEKALRVSLEGVLPVDVKLGPAPKRIKKPLLHISLPSSELLDGPEGGEYYAITIAFSYIGVQTENYDAANDVFDMLAKHWNRDDTINGSVGRISFLDHSMDTTPDYADAGFVMTESWQGVVYG